MLVNIDPVTYDAVPCKLPVKLPENILPVNLVADTDVRPVIVDANVKLSPGEDSVTKLVPAKSVNRSP